MNLTELLFNCLIGLNRFLLEILQNFVLLVMSTQKRSERCEALVPGVKRMGFFTISLMKWSKALPSPRLNRIKINKSSQKQYQYVLGEFILLKTKYQVWTKALDKKIEKPKEIFEVKILD